MTKKCFLQTTYLSLTLFLIWSISETQNSFGQVNGKKPGPAPKTGTLLDVTEQLTVKDSLDTVMQNSYCKTYAVEMIPGNTYVIDHMSGNFDCYLRLEDQNGRNLMADDDGGQGLNSRIVFTPTQQANYKIIATTLGGRQVGQFQLTVHTKQVIFRSAGKLTGTDPYDIVRQGCHFKVFRIRMEKDRIYTIDLTGNYDPYLRIEDSRGNPRGEDDDGGGNLNARMVFRPTETDIYRIIVTSCSGGRTGDYSLTVGD